MTKQVKKVQRAPAPKPRTNREIRLDALRKIINSSDIAAISTVYFFSAVSFIFIIEALIINSAKLLGLTGYKPFELDYYKSLSTGLLLMITRAAVYHVMLVAVSYLVRRYYINVTENANEVARYMSRHSRRLFIPSIKCGLKLTLFKLMLSVPLGLGIYGIVHFYHKGMTGSIHMAGLVMFMLCIGFSIVWAGVMLHYFVSLSLFKYIVELNPRVNFFDACDLSVKLMEGRHRRVFFFMVSLVPYALLCVFIYPAAVIFPYFTECRMLLAKDIMGEYWQDKLPAMAKRWEKQQARETYSDLR